MATLVKFIDKWILLNKDKGISKLNSDSTTACTGSIAMFAGPADKIPSDWLLCDGTEYNVTDYPELYWTIGNTYGGTEGSTFNVPDYRECTLVGAGQNSTDAVVTHDVYSVGQFKDDQLQQMTGQTSSFNTKSIIENGVLRMTSRQDYLEGNGGSQCGVYFDSARAARSGTTTHGKQKGVNYIIHI